MSKLEIKPGHAYALRVTGCKDENGTVRMPTEFIGEITLCKDCKHGKKSQGTGGAAIDCAFSYALKDPNGFCDDGEPREVDE